MGVKSVKTQYRQLLLNVSSWISKEKKQSEQKKPPQRLGFYSQEAGSGAWKHRAPQNEQEKCLMREGADLKSGSEF